MLVGYVLQVCGARVAGLGQLLPCKLSLQFSPFMLGSKFFGAGRHLARHVGGVRAAQPAPAGDAALLPRGRAARTQHHAHHPQDHRQGNQVQIDAVFLRFISVTKKLVPRCSETVSNFKENYFGSVLSFAKLIMIK